MIDLPSMTAVLLVVDLTIRGGLALRVVMRRLPVGVTLAWLLTLLAFPIAGALLYVLIGEMRLGRKRAHMAEVLRERYEFWLRDVRKRQFTAWETVGADLQPLSKLAEQAGHFPALPGNHLELIGDAHESLRRFISDIDASRRSCHLEFYIWHNGGLADQVGEALLRAAGRGVSCRVLLDAVGSHDFFNSEMHGRLKQAGVQVQEALPAGLIRMLFVRFDLRLHRKIVVIDGQVGYTGSLNLVDPDYFKISAGVGKWVDSVVRVQGPAVEAMAVAFLEDWELETGEDLENLRAAADIRSLPEAGNSAVQLLATGPMVRQHAIRDVLLTTIYSARHEIVMTSPYFVPDELVLAALVSAAHRGVDVQLIIPARVDSLLVRLASRAQFGDLIEAGVKIMLYSGGLLHTKSVTVDGRMCLIGSVNLDPRSLYLNFEITLIVYDSFFTCELRALQQTYLEQSTAADLQVWKNRSFVQKMADNLGRLWSPLL